jgi:hypothetical protein
MYLRELVNAPGQAANLASPLKSGQSLIHRSTGSEMRELSGGEDRSAVFCPNSLRDCVHCGRRLPCVVRGEAFPVSFRCTPAALRRAHDASVMLFGVLDRETHSIGKRLLRSTDFRCRPRCHLRRAPCPLRGTGQALRAGGRHSCKSNCNRAAITRLLCISCATHMVVPVHEGALGVGAPRPNVEFEERR